MSFISHTAFYTFWNKFLRILLKITVFTAVFHGCDRSHTTVYFVLTSLIKFECSRTLIASCKDTSHHADIRTGCNCFCDISGIFNTAICDNRNTVAFCHFITIHNCCNLRNTNTSNYTCGTDRTRSDTNLNCIYTSIDQSFCSCAGCNITCNYLKIRICILDLAYGTENIFGMTMRRIYYDYVNICFYKSIYTCKHIGCNTNSCTAEQTSLLIFCCKRIFDLFFDIFNRDQTF